jgi:hypothetical protein
MLPFYNFSFWQLGIDYKQDDKFAFILQSLSFSFALYVIFYLLLE